MSATVRRLARLLAVAPLVLPVLLGGCGDGDRERPTRLVVLGVDGADWDRAVPLLRQGKLPTFARLWRTGVRRTLYSLPFGPRGEERLSPTIWTTAVTGVLPERHGILNFVTPRKTGGAQPVTSNMRKTAALWNMLTARELTVGVVGWMVTWPAEPVNGYVVSSYAPFIFRWEDGPGRRPLKGTLIQGVPDQTWPPELQPTLEALKVAPESVDDEELERRFTLAPLPGARSRDAVESISGMRWGWAADATYLRAYEHVAAAPPTGQRPDLELLYFGSVDIISHRFWKYGEPDTYRLGDVDPFEIANYGQSVESAYRSVDGVLETVLGLESEEAGILVLSDHGFQENRKKSSGLKPTSSGWHRPEGLLLAAGPGFRRGERVGPGSVVDVAPTVLYALGLPVGRDMDGEPALELFTEELTERREVETIESWEPEVVRVREDAPVTSPVDGEILERLQALGYLD